MNSPFEKLRRTVKYYYYRRKNDWSFPSNMAHLTGGNIASGDYEPEVSEVVKENLTTGGLFIDVGANVGYFARFASNIVGANGKIFAFEVEPENYFVLTKNVNIYSNITPLNFAVSENNSFLSINHSSHSSCHSIVDTDNHLDGSQFRVPTITLDHFWQEYLQKQPVDLLKIDVEGAELLVLKGMEKMLAEKAVQAMVIEFCPRIIINAGFEPEDFYNILSSVFDLSIIDKDHSAALEMQNIENEQDFDILSQYLLTLEGAINSNLLCRQKQS